jgi:hypothetical protein
MRFRAPAPTVEHPRSRLATTAHLQPSTCVSVVQHVFFTVLGADAHFQHSPRLSKLYDTFRKCYQPCPTTLQHALPITHIRRTEGWCAAGYFADSADNLLLTPYQSLNLTVFGPSTPS